MLVRVKLYIIFIYNLYIYIIHIYIFIYIFNINLSREGIKALRDLKNYRDVVIKPACKGSAVLIWSLKEYREEIYAQLGESEVNEEVDNNPVKDLNEKVITKLKDLKDKGMICDENRTYFKPQKEAKIGRFYLLPEIHKRLYKVPGRPVGVHQILYPAG